MRQRLSLRYICVNVLHLLNSDDLIRFHRQLVSGCCGSKSSQSGSKAELLNGRLAMLGFEIGLLTEAITGNGIVSQITWALGCN